jgi:hypothetical protein
MATPDHIQQLKDLEKLEAKAKAKAEAEAERDAADAAEAATNLGIDEDDAAKANKLAKSVRQ